MRLKSKRLMALGATVMLLMMLVVYAEEEMFTVTFVIPSSITHDLEYGNGCSASLFYFVETDATKDGTMARMNVTSDTAGANECQTSTLPGITIYNMGSAQINVTMSISGDDAMPVGTGMKISMNDTGYEAACTGTFTNTTCTDLVNQTGYITVAYFMPAQNATPQNVWFWGNMTDFNSGVAGSDTAEVNTTSFAS